MAISAALARGTLTHTQCMQAGITAFASALIELPPQEKMPIGGVDGFIPYKPTADLIAAGEQLPPPELLSPLPIPAAPPPPRQAI